MRNLKRALSLTLASVMLLGMMVVGTSAAAGYDDVKETDNVEAIEVLQAIEVMVGDERGFGPERPVNRAEMAVVMGKLLSLDYNYYSTSCPFNDVYDWARGWVGACYANKIVSGRGEGVYDPGSTVTAVEAASMLMRALGYFQYQNDYADGFELSTVRQGTTIGIFDGVGSSATEPMTRNQVAQMVLNALRSGTVQPDGNTINLTTPDGTVLTGKVNYVYTTSNKAFAKAISKVEATSIGSTNDAPIVELGEQLYDGKLKLDDDALDPFGRPSRKWEYDGKAIGTYAKKELMVFDNVGKVVGTDLYNLLGATTLKDYDLRVAVDGIADPEVYGNIPNAVDDKANTSVVFKAADLNRNNKAKIGATGTGVLTQVFVDHETDDIYVAVINTYLAIADKAYDEKKEEASIEVYDITKSVGNDEYAKTVKRSKLSEKFKLGNEDFDLVKDIAKDDAYLVQVAEGKVQTIVPAEVLSGVSITSFNKNDFVVSGGTTYNYTTTAGYNHDDLDFYTSEKNTIENLKDRTYNIYLDAYGNLIGLKELDAAKNYVFITSIDRNGSYIANKTATANAVFLDGTSDVISINMTKSVWRDNRVKLDAGGTKVATSEFINLNDGDAGSSLLNTWCTYTKNGDVYTVREVYNVTDPTTTTTTNSVNGVAVDNGVGRTNYKPEDGTTNTTDLAQFHDVVRGGEITLKNGLRLNGGFTSGTFSNIYGDSDSVYLTADLGTVRASDGQKYGIIKGAETVYTGIDGTSISIYSKRDAQEEANKDKNSVDLALDTVGTPVTYGDQNSFGLYTLYDDEGIIIASMIVGEGSASKDLVYVISSDASLETDNGSSAKAVGDGLWTWEREVVRNGEKVKLTEVGDTIDALSKDNMKNHHWYEVKTDGNGNVTKAAPAFIALKTWTGNPNDSRSVFVGDYKNINNAVENEATDLVLYHETNGTWDEPNVADYPSYTHVGFGSEQGLEIQGKNVLAVTNKEGSGIYFRNDVHVVLEYYNRNVDGIDVMVGEGVDDLKDMVDFVNKNNEAAKQRNGVNVGRLPGETYYVSALIENGAATTIVIYDRYNDYVKPSDANIKYTLTLMGNLVDYEQFTDTQVSYTLNGVETKNISGTAKQMTVDGVTRLARDYTIPAGATVVIYDKETNTVTSPVYTVDKTGTNASGNVTIPVTVEKGNGTKSGTVSFVMAGNLTIDGVPTKDATGDYVTLTLGTGYTGAKVYVGNSSVAETPVIEHTGAGDVMTYGNIPKDAKVTIDVTGAIDDMTYTVNGVQIKQYPSTKRVMIDKMSADVRLDAPELITEQVYTLTFLEGTPKDFYGIDNAGGWASVSAGCLKKLTKGAAVSGQTLEDVDVLDIGGGKWQVKNGSALCVVELNETVTSTATTNEWYISTPGTTADDRVDITRWNDTPAAYSSRTLNQWTSGAVTNDLTISNSIDFSGEIQDDMIVYKSTFVAFDSSAQDTKIKFYGRSTDGGYSDEWFVLKGTTITADKFTLETGAPATGLIANTDNAIVGDNAAEKGVTVGTTKVTIYGAYKIEADTGINLKVAASGSANADSGTVFNGGMYVKSGSVVGAYSTGTNAADAIVANDGETYGDQAGKAIAANKDITIKAATKVTIASGKTGIHIEAVNGVTGLKTTILTGSGSQAEDIWVVPGTTIDVYGTNTSTLNVTQSGTGTDGEVTANADTAVIKVGTKAISITETP